MQSSPLLKMDIFLVAAAIATVAILTIYLIGSIWIYLVRSRTAISNDAAGVDKPPANKLGAV
jgi:hypothetical protein